MQKKIKKQNSPHKVTSSISDRKYKEFVTLLSSSRQNLTMSALIRDILSNKPVTVKFHDESLDLVMERLCSIQKEFQFIGLNVNMITRDFLTGKDLSKKKDHLIKVESLLQKVRENQVELNRSLDPIFKKWLPE